MRIILCSSTYSDDVKCEVMLLREMRNYDALAFYEMGGPEYRCQGIRVNEERMAHWLAVELIDGACVVLHPDMEPGAALQLAHVCDFLHAPLLHLRDLPEFAPEGREHVDLFRAEFTGLHRRARKPAHCGSVAALPELKRVPTVRIVKAMVDDNDRVIDLPRTPREWFRDQLLRFRRWEERFNARYGQLLKNPVSRELMEQRTAPVREYRLNTSPPSITN